MTILLNSLYKCINNVIYWQILNKFDLFSRPDMSGLFCSQLSQFRIVSIPQPGEVNCGRVVLASVCLLWRNKVAKQTTEETILWGPSSEQKSRKSEVFCTNGEKRLNKAVRIWNEASLFGFYRKLLEKNPQYSNDLNQIKTDLNCFRA